MRTLWIVLALALGFGSRAWAQTNLSQEPGSRTGHFADISDFASKLLGNRRNITVYLPPSYAASPGRRYPVLYAQDGQNLFDTRTAFLGREWQLDETVERLEKEGSLPEIIIVGVWNTPARITEYTPGESGDLYLRFLVEELKPQIDRRFRTRRDAKHTGILGSSMGGLISTWAALRYPNVFGQSASLSSVFQFKGEAITAWLNKNRRQRVRLYFDIGTQEVPDRPERYVENLSGMETELRTAGYRWGSDFVTYVDAGGHHDEPSWSRRVWRPLVFLFGELSR